MLYPVLVRLFFFDNASCASTLSFQDSANGYLLLSDAISVVELCRPTLDQTASLVCIEYVPFSSRK